MNATDYDEDHELFLYVYCRYCEHLKTEVEKNAERAHIARGKLAWGAVHGSHETVRRFLEQQSCVGDPEIEAALAEGLEAFRQRTYRRLVAEPAVQALINRCPQCRRIVASPKAKQCLWCHHDWHETVRWSI